MKVSKHDNTDIKKSFKGFKHTHQHVLKTHMESKQKLRSRITSRNQRKYRNKQKWIFEP